MLLKLNELFSKLEENKVHIDAAVKIIIKNECKDFFDKIKPLEQVEKKLKEFKVPEEAVKYILKEMDKSDGIE